MMPTLVFVYNADRGFFGALTDSVHKLRSPGSYACNLCAITHGAVGMRDAWRRFLESLDVPTEFRHRDELAAVDEDWPAILWRDDDGAYSVIVPADRINAAESLDDLEELVRSALAGQG